jgi:hypothetical protein
MVVRFALTILVAGGCAAAQSQANSVAIGQPTAMVTDAAGNLYFTATTSCGAGTIAGVFRMDPSGFLTQVAGNGTVGKPTQIVENYPPASGDGGWPPTRNS